MTHSLTSMSFRLYNLYYTTLRNSVNLLNVQALRTEAAAQYLAVSVKGGENGTKQNCQPPIMATILLKKDWFGFVLIGAVIIADSGTT